MPIGGPHRRGGGGGMGGGVSLSTVQGLVATKQDKLDVPPSALIKTPPYGWSLHSDNANPVAADFTANRLVILDSGGYLYVYDIYGVLKGKHGFNAATPVGLHIGQNNLWIGQQTGKAVAFDIPDWSKTTGQLTAATARDYTLALNPLRALWGTATNLFGVGRNSSSRPKRILAYRLTNKGLQTAFNNLGGLTAIDAQWVDPYYYLFSGDAIWRIDSRTIVTQAEPWKPLDLNDQPLTGATAWTWDGKRFWGIAAGKALAWSQDGKTLQIGEQPAASTAFAGPIKLASTNDFPLVGALKDDVAATPAGVEEWGDNRGLSNAVTGRPATAISDGVREALINIGEPVSEIGRFAANYGRVNFGRPSGWDNSSQALLVGYGMRFTPATHAIYTKPIRFGVFTMH